MPVPFLFVLYQFIKRLWSFLKDPEFRGLLVFVLLILLAGALFYHKVEGWNFLDALYFSVITLTTIGYGDFAPQTPAGKIFTMLYILVGLGVLAVFVTSIAEHALDEQRQQARARAEKKQDKLADGDSSSQE
ncbi:MAG: potassium channel family protein [Chloroflexota bacterium]